jgi:hypothetical protein
LLLLLLIYSSSILPVKHDTTTGPPTTVVQPKRGEKARLLCFSGSLRFLVLINGADGWIRLAAA